MDTRPWVHAGTRTAGGDPVRYTARGDTVFALVQGDADSAVLGEVRPTPTTEVTTVDGRSLHWTETPVGVSVDLPSRTTEAEPVVVVLERVEARPG